MSGIRVPEYCTAQVCSLYTMMGTEVIEMAIDSMGATHYRADIHNTPRHRRYIISAALTGLNTGTSMVNSPDIQDLNEKVEQLKGVMRDLLARSLTHQAEQSLLGKREHTFISMALQSWRHMPTPSTALLIGKGRIWLTFRRGSCAMCMACGREPSFDTTWIRYKGGNARVDR
ncbi:hypothetical protein chiPu_0023217 [Chiloscyllium punctatum]|uniref:Uncharacterized protein n=1 Tax=Chiloscyllium punctatum TaxID=137246 RepID=A0A401T9N0_CHIPU|nr:hypothetical protein [Chiloscyllium punctatum]